MKYFSVATHKVFVLFSFLFFLFNQSINAQYWAPLGATWYYHQTNFLSNYVDYLKIESVGDTVINGTQCKILQKTSWQCDLHPDREYMYDSSGQVFFWDVYMNAFQMVYDFNAAAGESWSVYLDGSGNDDTVYITVDSTSLTSINGFPRKVLYVTYQTVFPWWDFQPNGEIIETIGDTYAMFPWVYGACDYKWSAGIRCYEDTVVGFIQFDSSVACNGFFFTKTEEQYLNKQIIFYPNPVIDKLYFENSYEVDINRITIINGFGETLKTLTKRDRYFDLSFLPAGLYFITINTNSTNYFFKIIKQ
jgi:hypothetical protein